MTNKVTTREDLVIDQVRFINELINAGKVDPAHHRLMITFRSKLFELCRRSVASQGFLDPTQTLVFIQAEIFLSKYGYKAKAA